MTLDDSRTKIIATLGPASTNKDVLRKLFKAGVDVCRLNFSHGSHEQHGKSITTIRELNKELDINVAIMADLQGPKIRTGQIKDNKVMLVSGETIEFTSEDCIGTAKRVQLDYEDFANDVEEGDDILIDDGKIKLEVIAVNDELVKAKIIYGGPLSSRKGVNLPKTNVSLPSLTEKDISDAQFAIANDVDWIALSFVRAASDVTELKQLIKRKKKKCLVVAKIEKPQAIINIDEIIDETDGIMIARGDLGVEVDFDEVPLIQKMIVEKCINKSVPVIIATQMMESMVDNFRPTRAEATDVANAVIDGADTLMLSGETSVGKFPEETIHAMHKIIQHTELKGYNYNRGEAPQPESSRFIRDSVCYSASIMAERIGAKGIITFTDKGNTVSTISGYRPKADIFAFTPNDYLLGISSMYWGVRAFPSPSFKSADAAITFSIEKLKEKGFLKPDDYVIHIASTPMHVSHKTNMLKITKVK